VPNGIPNGRWYRIVPALIVLNCTSYRHRYNIGYTIAGALPGGHLAERGYAKRLPGGRVLRSIPRQSSNDLR
jgi:hypothetical protein